MRRGRRLSSRTSARRSRKRVNRSDIVAQRLFEAERFFEDFKALTPYPYCPFVRSFESFAEYERWKRAQTNPWYR
jgi:hypothetical protein